MTLFVQNSFEGGGVGGSSGPSGHAASSSLSSCTIVSNWAVALCCMRHTLSRATKFPARSISADRTKPDRVICNTVGNFLDVERRTLTDDRRP